MKSLESRGSSRPYCLAAVYLILLEGWCLQLNLRLGGYQRIQKPSSHA